MPPRPEGAIAAGQPPVPSLLRSLMSEHLDPGYTAAAERPGPRHGDRLWQVLGAILVAAVFAAAVASARSTAPGLSATQRMLTGSVLAAQQRTDDLASRRRDLAGEADDLQRRTLAADGTGRALLDDLDQLGLSAADTALAGPGVTVTITEPTTGARQVILDRDLQLVVNALWAGGAEAVAVGGVRIGPDVTIRQAGGAVLVDNQPIANPYTVVAIGPPEAMAESFGSSGALSRLRLLESAYRVGVAVSTADHLSVPAAGGREVTFAQQASPANPTPANPRGPR